MSKYITKNLFLSTLTCPTFGWLQRHQPPVEDLSPADQLRIDEGVEVQQRARSLFPDGVMISGDNITASKTTQKFLKDQSIDTIFEATFLSDPYVTKADVLARDNSQWKIIEIKSNVNLSDDLIDDLAYTTMVAGKAGLDISSCSLLLVNKEYRLGMADEELFVEHDVTEEVLERVGEFEQLYDHVIGVLSQEEKPTPFLKWQCKNCEIFEECCGEGIENHIFDLPRLSHTKYCQLRDLEVLRINDIPEECELTPTQEIVRKAVVSGEVIVDRDGKRDALYSIVYPAYYLDFETMQTCIPLYEGMAPYAQVPTQYSLHICSEAGKVDEHREYLAQADRDCRRELAERLIGDCGSEGSIVVYTSFEKTIINRLADLFPDLAEDLGRLVDRLVDLYKIIRDNYYHPGFHGSYSIKKVLPVVVPGLGYDGMDIDNGLDASAEYAYMAMGRYDDEEEVRIREQLKLYCGRDTEAMVRLEGGADRDYLVNCAKNRENCYIFNTYLVYFLVEKWGKWG